MLAFFILLNSAILIRASNYDAYMARLAAESQLVKDEFLRQNPRGQMILDRLHSPEFVERNLLPKSQTGGGYQIDDEQWMNFLAELEAARKEAALDREEEIKRGPDHLDREYIEVGQSNNDYANPPEVFSRTLEHPYQNYLWGTHKVSGGSSEVGKWLDYALLGAGAQDEDENGSQDLGDLEAESVIKNDTLPAYCDPPNPCPLGYDPDTMPAPCDPSMRYTMEFNRAWIMSKMASGECSCDSEHMNTCEVYSGVNSRGIQVPGETEKLSHENPYLLGQKRKRLVAKKASSYYVPQKDYYLQGKILKTVVKKNGQHALTPDQ